MTRLDRRFCSLVIFNNVVERFCSSCTISLQKNQLVVFNRVTFSNLGLALNRMSRSDIGALYGDNGAQRLYIYTHAYTWIYRFAPVYKFTVLSYFFLFHRLQNCRNWLNRWLCSFVVRSLAYAISDLTLHQHVSLPAMFRLVAVNDVKMSTLFNNRCRVTVS